MKWLLGHLQPCVSVGGIDLTGHLFGGRYKAQLIDESTAGYLRVAAHYVHLNPANGGWPVVRVEHAIGCFHHRDGQKQPRTPLRVATGLHLVLREEASFPSLGEIGEDSSTS